MEQLPVEIVLHIISFLETPEIVKLQILSRRFFSLTRDSHLWKQICYSNSRSAAIARRQKLLSSQPVPLAALVQAMGSLPSSSQLTPPPDPDAPPNGGVEPPGSKQKEQVRILANWDPGYASEKVDWYQEYVQRHANIKASWFPRPGDGDGYEKETREATGVGVLYAGSDVATNLISPMDDGSICVWDLTPNDPYNRNGRRGMMSGRSSTGLLTARNSELTKNQQLTESKAVMTETGAVECVSIDSWNSKGYFAVQNCLHEVDLRTLQVLSRQKFPFPITALSEARTPVPITVGTNMTLHLHDPRAPLTPSNDETSSVRCELIGGASPSANIITLGGMPRRHVNLSQPGPLSILHLPCSKGRNIADEIWVAGRFTSLLSYDRRLFPKIAGTIHSGARISSITSIPHPYIPREPGVTIDHSLSIAEAHAIRSIPGTSIIAAGEYKTKGSLEIYGLSTDADYGTLCAPQSPFGRRNIYQNRQTASRCKLLSVASHGTTFVFSDGDGNLKWVERDGFTTVRQWNINPEPEEPPSPWEEIERTERPRSVDDDIVQKIIPISVTANKMSSTPENLLLWTGDGKLGLLSYGDTSGFDAQAAETDLSVEDELRLCNERQYAGTMRRALERQADEVRWFGTLNFE